MPVRIGGGTRKGRTLRAPAGKVTRPFLARTRQSLLGILAPRIPGARVLDAFAGTGSFGLEALSRGAAAAVFVEREPGAVRLLEDAVARFAHGGARVIRGEVEPALADLAGAGEAFEVVMLDPPFALERDEVLLRGAAPVLAEGGVVLLRVPTGRALAPAIGGLALDREERYGASRVGFYRSAR